MIYLDNQSTTSCDPRVLDAMWPFFAIDYANPHSAEHAPGRLAAEAVQRARSEVASLLGADPREIVFTSGATEANNIAIKGAARQALATGDKRRRLVTLAAEHPCVLESVRDLAAEGFEPVVLPVARDGRLDLGMLADALRVPSLLVSVMAANNETGVLQDLAAIARLAHASGALVHSDLAQAAGKLPLDVASLGLDLASVSAHKMHGPKGVGALFVRRRPRIRLAPLLSGGGQERGLRSGTLPTPLVVGFGQAARIAGEEREAEAARLLLLRTRLWTLLARDIPGLRLNGHPAERLAGNLNLCFPEASATEIISRAEGLALSTGSACSSTELRPSTVLTAMGLTADEARRSLRLGLGRFTSAAEIERAAAILVAAWRATALADTPPSMMPDLAIEA